MNHGTEEIGNPDGEKSAESLDQLNDVVLGVISHANSVWELSNGAVEALLAILAGEISGALNQPVQLLRRRRRSPRAQLRLPGRVQTLHPVRLSGEFAQQLLGFPVEFLRVAHLLDVPHVELVAVVYLPQEILLRVLHKTIVGHRSRSVLPASATQDLQSAAETSPRHRERPYLELGVKFPEFEQKWKSGSAAMAVCTVRTTAMESIGRREKSLEMAMAAS
nr:hypothetical protein Iba_chr06aCG19080 [Ipomoea batatas]